MEVFFPCNPVHIRIPRMQVFFYFLEQSRATFCWSFMPDRFSLVLVLDIYIHINFDVLLVLFKCNPPSPRLNGPLPEGMTQGQTQMPRNFGEFERLIPFFVQKTPGLFYMPCNVPFSLVSFPTKSTAVAPEILWGSYL